MSAEIVEEKKEVTVKIDKDTRNAIIDKFIMGVPIEKEISIPFKNSDRSIKLTLGVPTSGLASIADIMLYRESEIASVMAYNNINLLGMLITKYMDKDFRNDQGDKFNTSEGLKERIVYLQSHLIGPLRDVIVQECKQFMVWYNEIFQKGNLEDF